VSYAFWRSHSEDSLIAIFFLNFCALVPHRSPEIVPDENCFFFFSSESEVPFTKRGLSYLSDLIDCCFRPLFHGRCVF